MAREARTVLVTGAAGGIGSAVCRLFAGAGDRVIAVDRDAARLEALGQSLGDAAFAHAVADVTDLGAMKAVASSLGASGIDVVIANAGGVRDEIVGDYTETWVEDIALNLTGAAWTVEAALPRMERGAAIVLIGSVNGQLYLGHPGYSAAKAGLVGHMRSLACLLGPRGIRVNLVAPGTVRTPAWEERLARDPQILSRILPWYPIGEICRSEDVANVVRFLTLPESRMIHGAVIPVDGGLTAGNPVMAAAIGS